jgi:glycosyltransferase involved in cell wall biosynthesis
MKISILIAYAPWHVFEYNAIRDKLFYQIKENNLLDQIEIVSNGAGRELTLGKKRNLLMEEAKGEYIIFVDADDDVADNYIKELYEASRSGYDTASMDILMTTDGVKPQMCYHSLKNKHWFEHNDVYYRSVTQFNLIKRHLAIEASFPENIKYGDDHEFSNRVTKLCKTEYKIKDIIYYYKFKTTPAHEKGFE